MIEINWNPSYKEAVKIQNDLLKYLIVAPMEKEPSVISACDVSVTRKEDIAFVAIVTVEMKTKTIIEEKSISIPVSFPYIPGLLAFREGPGIILAYRQLKIMPDLIIFDGHGICHPRGMGIASFVGIILGIPSIGCAKSHLYGEYSNPGLKRGDFSLVKGDNDKEIGIVLRTRNEVSPVYVSPGHMSDFNDARRIILYLTSRYRNPDPLRYAHSRCKSERKEYYSGTNVK